jgi:ABC-2 type transport system permease protein
VAGREIRERLRGKVFRVITVILFAAVAAAIVIPTLRSGTTQSERVGIVDGSPQLSTELLNLARGVGLRVQFVSESNLAQARAGLAAGRIDMAIDGTKRIIVENPISPSDASPSARFIREASVGIGEQRAYAQAALSSQQAAILARAKPLPIKSVKPKKARKTTSETTALLGIILIFIVLNQYLAWTLMGVMEEKASRVVEVLLATVRPIQLLAGKVIGIGVVALAQAAGLVIFALVLGAAVGSSLVQGTAPLVVAATLLWLVLGYSFYSWVYAAAGSMAERQDQVQSLVLPLSIPLILGYIVSLMGVSSGSASLLVKILAYIPPTAPFAMPALVGFGEATWWEFLLSVVLCIICTIFMALFAARIYRTAVLKTGGRVRLRQLTTR